jgi:HrpA-like RNA helicase
MFRKKKERNNLVQAVKNSETVIIMGEMGSGKSTRTYIIICCLFFKYDLIVK